MVSDYVPKELSFMPKQGGKNELKKQQQQPSHLSRQIVSKYFQKSGFQVKYSV